MTSEALQETLRSWLWVLDSVSHYQVLDVAEDASGSAIKTAFHRFAEGFHPDRHRALDGELRDQISTVFRRGAEAYRVLRDPRLRADYDLELAKHRGRLSLAPPSERPRSLDELCQTKGGQLHARQAQRALTEDDPQQAHKWLTKALLAEGENPELQDRLEALEALLLLSGPGRPPPDVAEQPSGQPLDHATESRSRPSEPKPRP